MLPNTRQLELFEQFFEAVNEGIVTPDRMLRKIHFDDNPLIVKQYRVRRQINTEGVNERVQRLLESLTGFSVTVRWGIDGQFVPTFDIMGTDLSTTNITLLGFPRIVATRNDAKQLFRTLTPMTPITEYDVYENGARVTMRRVGVPVNEHYPDEQQFYFIGSFVSRITQESYYLYGTNDLLGLERRMLYSEFEKSLTASQ